jgi:hypothetical protein
VHVGARGQGGQIGMPGLRTEMGQTAPARGGLRTAYPPRVVRIRFLAHSDIRREGQNRCSMALLPISYIELAADVGHAAVASAVQRKQREGALGGDRKPEDSDSASTPDVSVPPIRWRLPG